MAPARPSRRPQARLGVNGAPVFCAVCLGALNSRSWCVSQGGRDWSVVPRSSFLARSGEVRGSPGSPGSGKTFGQLTSRDIGSQQDRSSGGSGLRGGPCPEGCARVLRRALPEGAEDFFVDEEALLSQSSFSITPEALLERAKAVFATLSSDPLAVAPELSDDFVGLGPLAGPLDKDGFIDAITSIDFLKGFPDTKPNYHFLRVDPFEPNRVWVQMRVRATNTGECMGPPTNKALEFPPESYSLVFDDAGKVKKFTFGYVMDRFIGNTGGLGGAFGYLYGIDRPAPFPEGRPHEKSWQFQLVTMLNNLQREQKKKSD